MKPNHKLAFATTAVALALSTATTTAAYAQTSTANTTTTTSPAANSARLITSTEPNVQRDNRSTSPAVAPATTSSAWEVISKDANTSEFASLVRLTKLEDLFTRTTANYTFVVPTNSAFNVLDPKQLDRLKQPQYRDQLTSVIRQHVMVGRNSLNDFTRSLATGLPSVPPSTIQSCVTTPTVITNGRTTGGETRCTSLPVVTPRPAPQLEQMTVDGGRSVNVRAVAVRPVSGGANRFRVFVTNAQIEIADYPVTNGVVHTLDGIIMPPGVVSITDVVGRR